MTDRLTPRERERYNEILRAKSTRTPDGDVQNYLSDDDLKEYYRLSDILTYGRPLARGRNHVPLEELPSDNNISEYSGEPLGQRQRADGTDEWWDGERWVMVFDSDGAINLGPQIMEGISDGINPDHRFIVAVWHKGDDPPEVNTSGFSDSHIVVTTEGNVLVSVYSNQVGWMADKQTITVEYWTRHPLDMEME